MDGRSNREIADLLFVSEATVKTHVMAVLRKLVLRDRIQAVIFGYESVWCDQTDRDLRIPSLPIGQLPIASAKQC